MEMSHTFNMSEIQVQCATGTSAMISEEIENFFVFHNELLDATLNAEWRKYGVLDHSSCLQIASDVEHPKFNHPQSALHSEQLCIARYIAQELTSQVLCRDMQIASSWKD